MDFHSTISAKKVTAVIFCDQAAKAYFDQQCSGFFENYLAHAVDVFEGYLFKNLLSSKVEQVELSLQICSDQQMRVLNKKYRQKDKTTDVLSFPIFEQLRDQQDSERENLPMIELGDIIISFEKAKEQAAHFNIAFEDECIHLFTHGFLHLCGYDHEISLEEEKLMEKIEKELIEQIATKRQNEGKD